MDGGILSPPQEQDRAVVDRLEGRRSIMRRRSPMIWRGRNFTQATTRSVASDPGDFAGTAEFLSPLPLQSRTNFITPYKKGHTMQQTVADDDVELVTNDTDDEDKMTLDHVPSTTGHRDGGLRSTLKQPYCFVQRPPLKAKTPELSTSIFSTDCARFVPQLSEPPKSRRESSTPMALPTLRPQPHRRGISDATVFFNAATGSAKENSSSQDNTNDAAKPFDGLSAVHGSRAPMPISRPTSSAGGRGTRKRPISNETRPWPIMPPKNKPGFKSAPDLAGLTMMHKSRPADPRPSSIAMEIGSDIGDNKAAGRGYIGTIPASFATEMAYATGGGLGRPRVESEYREILEGIVLARMNNLEECFREMVHEMRDHMRRNDSRSESRDRGGRSGSYTRQQSRKGKDRKREAGRGKREYRLKTKTAKSAANTRRNSDDEWMEEPDEAQIARRTSVSVS